MERVVSRSELVPWQNGREVVRSMTPAFRQNLGPTELVEDLFARYDQQPLLNDQHTTRRIDLIDVKPGYRDLTNAYHDSVEECLVLAGHLHLDGEGDFEAGDYFWRPPGFVHAASTDTGFRALLMFQGDDPAEGSGPTSRRIQPDELAGTNQLHADPETAVGPRGWVRRQPTDLLPWLPGPAWSSTRHGQLDHPDLDRIEVRVLSENVGTGGQSLLARIGAGWHLPVRRLAASLDIVVLDGALHLGDDEPLVATDLVHLPAGEALELCSPVGARLFVKADDWLTPTH